MNRIKSILLGATALAMVGLSQQAAAQGITYLPAVVPAPDTCGASIGNGTIVDQINASGTVIIGTSESAPNCIVRWVNGVPQIVQGGGAGFPAGTALRRITGISGDGQVFAYSLSGSNSGQRDQFRMRYWTPATSYQAFADPSANEIILEGGGVSTDGTYFAVSSRDLQPAISGAEGQFTLGNQTRLFRWSAAGGYEDLGNLPQGIPSAVTGISGDGSKIVGQVFVPDALGVGGRRSTAILWQSGAGMSQLPDLSAAPRNGTLAASTATYGISRDGTTIIGQSRGSDGFNQAVIWRSGAATGLGFLPGFAPTDIFFGSINATIPQAISADGSVVVGFIPTADSGRAWRWSAGNGMQDLTQLATNAGFNLNGLTLISALDISDDARSIIGQASNGTDFSGYVLQLQQVTQSRLIVTIRLPGVTQTAIVNQTFNTQVDALLNGASVFTRTTTDPITGAGGVAALADARAALQVGGGLRRLVIGAPVLLSNTTTVLGTTSNTVDVASGTTTSTATVNTFGPTTVATGDRGTCTTAAANGENPTGCTLPGTPVTVDVGILNSNVFTNTLNSVTPTTTQSVNQLVTARWQISATAGNQFGTVHALVGPVTFDRGDRLIAQLFGMGHGSTSAAPVTRAALPMRDANGYGSDGDIGGLSLFGGYFGNWTRIDADPSVPVANVHGSTNGFILGLEQPVGDGSIGLALDHGSSDYSVRDATYPETLDYEHTQLALFAAWADGGFSIDGAAAYGFGSARTSLTTPTTAAVGKRDVRSWSLGAQAGYTLPLGETAHVEFVAGVRHTSANLDRFSETGGPTPLIGLDETVSRTRLYAGVEVEAQAHVGGIAITPRVHARAGHDSGDASGTADLVFASAPTGPVMQAVGPGVGRTVAELGGSLDAHVSDRVHLWLGYDSTLRSHAQSHAVKAGVTVQW